MKIPIPIPHTVHTYIFDIPETDYIATTIKRTAIFIQKTTPNLPIIWNMDHTEPRMHYKMQALLYFLHKLKVRPSL